MRKNVRILLLSIIMLVFILLGNNVTSKEELDLKIAENEMEVMVQPTIEMETTTEVDPETEPETEPPTPAPVKVHLIAIGDMLLHDVVQESGLMADGTYNYDHFFSHMGTSIRNADVAVVNEEVIIGGAERGIQGYPTFNCREEVGDALVKAGFDVILHATNHTMDQRQAGIDYCMDFWDNNYPEINYLGIHRTEDDYNDIYIYEKDGFKIAMLNYTYGLNGYTLPVDRPYLVNLLDEEKVISDITRAEEIADFTIVYPHWGTEYVYEPDKSQLKWAQLFADYGADLVIGTHPHVIEPVTWVTGVNGNQMLVYYSLGNFISAQSEAPRMLGAMADVVLEKDNDGTVGIVSYDAIPLVTQRVFGSGASTTYKLTEYTEELAAQNTILSVDASFSIKMLNDLWSQVFGDSGL